MADQVKLVFEGIDDISDIIKKINNNLGKLDNKTKKSSESVNVFNKSINAMKNAVIGYLSVSFAKKIAEEAFQLGELGAQAEFVRKNFNKFASDAGKNSTKMLDKLRKATLGMVDDMALQQNAMKSMISGISFDDLVVAMEYVTRYALATGEDVTTKMQTVMTGLARGSAQFMDDVGIQVIGSANVVKDTIDQMKEKMGNFADETGETSLQIAKMKSEIKNAAIIAGKELEPVIKDITELIAKWGPSIIKFGGTAINWLAKILKANFTSYTLNQAALDLWVERMRIVKDETDYVKNLNELYKKRDELIVKLTEKRRQLKELEKSGGATADPFGLGSNIIDKQKKEVAELEGMFNSVNNAIKDLNKEYTQVLNSQTKKKDKTKDNKTKDNIDEENYALQQQIKILEKDISLLNDKYNKAIQLNKKQIDAMNTLTNDMLSQENREILAAQNKYEKMIQLFDEYSIERKLLEEQMQKEITKIEQRYEEERRLKKEESEAAKAEKMRKTLSGVLDVTQQITNAIDSYLQNSINKESSYYDSLFEKQKEDVQNSKLSRSQKEKEINKIEEQARKKRYELALKDWRRSLVMANVNTALAITKTMANMGFPAAIPFMIAAGVAGAINTAMILANKPKFATGGIVPGESFTGDKINAGLNSREMVLNMNQQKRLFDIAEGKVNPKPAQITIQAPNITINGNLTDDNIEEIREITDTYRKKVAKAFVEAVSNGEINIRRLT